MRRAYHTWFGSSSFIEHTLFPLHKRKTSRSGRAMFDTFRNGPRLWAAPECQPWRGTSHQPNSSALHVCCFRMRVPRTDFPLNGMTDVSSIELICCVRFPPIPILGSLHSHLDLGWSTFAHFPIQWLPQHTSVPPHSRPSELSSWLLYSLEFSS